MASSATRQRLDVTRCRKCLSFKIGYRTRDEALDVAERMMEQGFVKPGCHITPYHCSLCDEWHVANRQIVFTPKA